MLRTLLLQKRSQTMSFKGHPPLGVNATARWQEILSGLGLSFNGHPPLGVNATAPPFTTLKVRTTFQWAPTLGGECYSRSRWFTP